MDQATHRRVRQRAGNGCESCLLPQEWSPLARLQIEHITPRKHGGSDDDENLGLACIHCNSHKGSHLTGIDPVSGATVELFDPRKQNWTDQFSWNGVAITGVTPCGRTTVRVMNMNSDDMLSLRTVATDPG